MTLARQSLSSVSFEPVIGTIDSAFSSEFTILDATAIEGSERILYRMARKTPADA